MTETATPRTPDGCECGYATTVPGCSAESGIYPPLPGDWRERLAR